MIKGIYHVAAGMLPRESQQEAISNNLANVNTTGFKAVRRLFRTTLDNRLLQGGPGGTPIRPTDYEYDLQTDHSQGSLDRTRNPLDIAISGNGFFTVETDDGIFYTRNGNFKLNQDNELINSLGHTVQGEGGAIVIEGGEVIIKENGNVIVDGNSVDRLQIVDFEQPYDLQRNGYGYFIPTDPMTAIDAENYRIMQGHLEKSNVNVVRTMVEMIELNRIYQALQKSMHAQDETLKAAVNEIARS